MNKTKKINPLAPACSEENSLTERLVRMFGKQNAINKIVITELDDDSYYVSLYLKLEPQKRWYLTKERLRTTPRIFVKLSTLSDFLKEICPHVGFELVRTPR